METSVFNRFIHDVVANESVWLLQATDGMFAMVESADRKSFLAVWDRESDAQKAASDEWQDYSIVHMDLTEWIHWLNEMAEDEAWIGVCPDEEGRILPVEAAKLLEILVGERKAQRN